MVPHRRGHREGGRHPQEGQRGVERQRGAWHPAAHQGRREQGHNNAHGDRDSEKSRNARPGDDEDYVADHGQRIAQYLEDNDRPVAKGGGQGDSQRGLRDGERETGSGQDRSKHQFGVVPQGQGDARGDRRAHKGQGKAKAQQHAHELPPLIAAALGVLAQPQGGHSGVRHCTHGGDQRDDRLEAAEVTDSQVPGNQRHAQQGEQRGHQIAESPHQAASDHQAACTGGIEDVALELYGRHAHTIP